VPPVRTLTTPLLTPVGRRWWARQRDARAARQVEREAQRANARALADISAGARQARRGTGWIPRAGEPGPSALRCWRRFAVPPHAATSAVLAGAYPFLAEGGLGSEGMFVGTDLFSGAAANG
jgi:hypothetical protein